MFCFTETSDIICFTETSDTVHFYEISDITIFFFLPTFSTKISDIVEGTVTSDKDIYYSDIRLVCFTMTIDRGC